MKVQQILQYIEKYKSYLSGMTQDDQLYKWEFQERFATYWNEEDQNLPEMYDTTFRNAKSGFLWGGEKDSPKSAMIQMMTVEPEFSRTMFRDLFAEDKELLLRLDRFGYHCDQVLPKVQKQYANVIEHYHHNYKILSVYLALKYPDKYCIYDFSAFHAAMVKMGIQTPPQEFEIIRFNKLIKTIQLFLMKDVTLLQLHKERISGEGMYQKSSLLLAHDFYWTVGNLEYNIEKY